MKRVILVAVALIAVFATLSAQNKQKGPIFPALVSHARYVYVATMYGDPLSANLDIPPEDRQAASDLQNAIKKWGHYALVYRPGEADLTIVVRRARSGSVGIATTVGTDRRSPRPAVGGEVSNVPDDLMFIYDAQKGSDSAPLLRYTEKNGLEPPTMRLLAEFRKDVEAAEQAEKDAAKKP